MPRSLVLGRQNHLGIGVGVRQTFKWLPVGDEPKPEVHVAYPFEDTQVSSWCTLIPIPRQSCLLLRRDLVTPSARPAVFRGGGARAKAARLLHVFIVYILDSRPKSIQNQFLKVFFKLDVK